jgi:hypothetical protein
VPIGISRTQRKVRRTDGVCREVIRGLRPLPRRRQASQRKAERFRKTATADQTRTAHLRSTGCQSLKKLRTTLAQGRTRPNSQTEADALASKSSRTTLIIQKDYPKRPRAARFPGGTEVESTRKATTPRPASALSQLTLAILDRLKARRCSVMLLRPDRSWVGCHKPRSVTL